MMSHAEEINKKICLPLLIADTRRTDLEQNLLKDENTIAKHTNVSFNHNTTKIESSLMSIQLVKNIEQQFDNYRKNDKILEIDTNNDDFIITLDETVYDHVDLSSKCSNISIDNKKDNSSTNIYQDVHSAEINDHLNSLFSSKSNFKDLNNISVISEENFNNYPIEVSADDLQNVQLENSKFNSNSSVMSSILVDTDNILENVCPSCNMEFDKGKKRKVIDSCGHVRCCSCMYCEESCSLCNTITSLADYESGIGGSISTIVSPISSPKCLLKIHKFSELTSNPKKNFEKNRSPETSQIKLKFFNSTVKTSFGKGHRRTLSNGNTKESQNGPNINEISVCSDTIATKKSTFNNLANSGSENKSNALSLVSAGQLSSMVFGKIKSLWNAQSCSINAGLNQLAGNKIYPNGIQGKITILTDKPEENQREYLETVSINSEKSENFIKHIIKDHKSKSNFNSEKSKSFQNTSYVKMKTCTDFKNCESDNIELNMENNEIIQKQIQLNLKPLFFEVPNSESDLIFIGRQWILRELSNILTVTETPGVLINGKSGAGKTSLILQLVEYSCFGRKKSCYIPENDGIYCQINIGHDRIKALASYVVAYHFCQADNNITCHVADFIHSVAAQLCQAPQLMAYQEFLERNEDLRNLLEIKECCANPEYVMYTAILEPLSQLKISGKITAKICVILIDALCEAEYHRPDYGYTISSFLSKISNLIPAWLKIVATVRSNMKEHIKGLPYAFLTLDIISSNDFIEKDILDYITFRINHSVKIQKNVGLNKDNLTTHYKLINHILTISSGSFLFSKLLMDLIENDNLVIKASSYKILPAMLSEIYLLKCNLRFQTNSAFEKVVNILNVCLSSLYPLTAEDIYLSIVALSNAEHIDYNEFLNRFKLLNGFLIRRLDNTYMFFHPSFREWLLGRDYNESTKFLCNFRIGHTALAIRLSRVSEDLDPEKTLELCHHILKANMFRKCQLLTTIQDIQSCWLTTVSNSISFALCVLKNIYSPNIKVSRFLLLAGASPDVCTKYMEQATILCVASYEGIIPLVSLLLEFGANINKTNRQGCTPLILSSIRGHCDIIRLLISAGSDISKKDLTQQCALVHAARNGHINVVKYLLACQCSLYIKSLNQVLFEEDLLQALVAAAANDYVNIVEYILDIDKIDINGIDRLTGDTALTMAAKNGSIRCIEILLARGADIDAKNKDEYSALLLAVKEGYLSITEKLIQNNTNVEQIEKNSEKNSFIIAAAEGHLCILHLLVKYSIEKEAVDIEGLTALSWACLNSHYEIVKVLIKIGCNTDHEDKLGRSLLDLAVYKGTPNLVNMLLEYGLKIEHTDKNGIGPLDRSIACRNRNVVQILLKKGAKLGPITWVMVADKYEIFIILINKLLEDGNLFYQKKQYHDAAHRYKYALRKVSSNLTALERNSIFVQLKVNLLLNLSRSRRKTHDLADAIDLATQAIELKPLSYQGYYARSKAKLEKKYFNEAYADAKNAFEKSKNETLEVKTILQQFYDDIQAIILKNEFISSYEVSEL